MAEADLGSLGWGYSNGIMVSNELTLAKRPSSWATVANILCSMFLSATANAVVGKTIDNAIAITPTGSLYVYASAYTSAEAFKTAMDGVQLVYELATPVTYQLDPTEVTTLLGQNNIWSDTGDTTVEYRADTKLYIQKVLSS